MWNHFLGNECACAAKKKKKRQTNFKKRFAELLTEGYKPSYFFFFFLCEQYTE
jgi:hypothetical protein